MYIHVAYAHVCQTRIMWMTRSASLLLQKNPVWQALLDDADNRGTIVRNANAAELFPNMTELHLMQANRKAPASDLQHHSPAKGGPAGTQGQTQEPKGAIQATRGVREGRGGARGGARGGPGRLLEGPGRGHSIHSAAGAVQIQQQAGSQQTLPGTQGSFAAYVQQEHLTPAQQAIQQGKLRQQQQQQQNDQQYQQHDQPVSAHQRPQQQQAQQAQQQQQPVGQRGLADEAAGQQPGFSMQGVQHSHWDNSYSGGATNRDPRQMPISQSHTGLQAGASQSLRRPPGPRPAGWCPSFGLAPQNSRSQLAAGPMPSLGHHAVQHASAAGDAFAGQVSDGPIMSQYSDAAPISKHGARPAMPAIPGASGWQATHDHSMSGLNQSHADQQEQGGVDAPRQAQGLTQLQGDSIALGSLSQTNAISTSPHAMHVAQAGDPGRALQGSDVVMPIAAYAAQDMRLGRNIIPSRHSETTSQIPQWTNNRR